MPNLKNCPFCGKNNSYLWSDNNEELAHYNIQCIECGADGSITADKKFAKELWNDRPIEESLTAQLEEARKALRTFIYETTHLSAREEDGSHWCRISEDTLGKGREIYYKLTKKD